MQRPEFVDDPEKGILDTLTPLPVLPVSSKAVIQDAAVGLEAQSGKKESQVELALATYAKKDHASANKPKRKLKKWHRFQLWFNTYRCVDYFIVLETSLTFLQQILHLRSDVERRWCLLRRPC